VTYADDVMTLETVSAGCDVRASVGGDGEVSLRDRTVH